ncbi:BA_1872 family lipoprotein [Bacillus cereus group sp. Bce002]|uniref:BA_1872 family lipoprotein n=1 Tax=Bacillus cereus group sp. Bce002 TaxID=3445259 RepID=UPI003F252B60
MKLIRVFMILTLVVLLSACNTATQVTKVQKNGETTLKIGSLQGYYDIQTLKAEKGNVEIPYEAAVEEGTILLQVTKDDKVIYEEEITSQKEGLLSFEAPKSGSYDLIVRVKGEKEKAKEIQIHTKL